MAKLCHFLLSKHMVDTSLTYTPCWYAIHTRSNQEKIACEALLGRGFECFLPKYETVSQWKDRRVLIERPLFPGYLFARVPAAHKVKVMMAHGVVDVLCDRPGWDAIDEFQVQCLKSKLSMHRTEPHVYLPVGSKVTIASGPFAGLEGILIQHRYAKDRVVVSLPAIVRAFSIEVEPSEVRESASMNASQITQAAFC
jgi:transcription antitermination factor NusG